MRAEVSPTTWQSLENHKRPVSEITAAGMCRALGWTSTSIETVLDGGEPMEVDGDDRLHTFTRRELMLIHAANEGLAGAIAEHSEAIAELRAAVEEIVERSREREPRP